MAREGGGVMVEEGGDVGKRGVVMEEEGDDRGGGE